MGVYHGEREISCHHPVLVFDGVRCMTTLLSIVIYLMQRGVRYNRSERKRVFSFIVIQFPDQPGQTETPSLLLPGLSWGGGRELRD